MHWPAPPLTTFHILLNLTPFVASGSLNLFWLSLLKNVIEYELVFQCVLMMFCLLEVFVNLLRTIYKSYLFHHLEWVTWNSVLFPLHFSTVLCETINGMVFAWSTKMENYKRSSNKQAKISEKVNKRVKQRHVKKYWQVIEILLLMLLNIPSFSFAVK